MMEVADGTIPIVDLAPYNSSALREQTKVARQVHDACRDIGFFYIVNHGVPPSLVNSQFASAREFFALPIDEKLAIHMKNSPSSAGYEPVGSQVLGRQTLNQHKAVPVDLKESFYSAMELPDDHPWALKRIRGYGYNQWPARMPSFRSQTLAYHKAMTELGSRLLTLFALSVDLPANYFVPFFEMPRATLRQVSYPPTEDADPAQLGAGEHTDWGGITILAQDELGGLEVRTAAGHWIAATPIPDAFVINIGDLMQRWTNDLYRSTTHRVQKTKEDSTKSRNSIPFFYSPRRDAIIECMPTCVSANNPPRYKPIEAGDHTDEMFRRSYAG